MSAELTLQLAVETDNLPDQSQCQRWVDAVFERFEGEFSLCARIVDSAESQALNNQYRAKDKPTNVLSFCFEMPACIEGEPEILGDLVICAEVVAAEAIEQNKAHFDHWAHMFVHGVLHLLGFDHIKEEDAVEMEQLEREILAQLSIEDPYSE
ncbi:MAG: rRNA maturation RNase YbeY [Pseudomonadales bacterium]